MSILQLPQLQKDILLPSALEELDRSPAQCIRSGDWLRAGLDVPPFDTMSRGWSSALRYSRLLDLYVPSLPLPPDVHNLPYEQRKHAILYSSTIPSDVNLGRRMIFRVFKPELQQDFTPFVPLSCAEVQQLVYQLNKHSDHVVHLNLNHNEISGGEDAAALCRSLAALTGLHTLDLSGMMLCMLCEKTFVHAFCVQLDCREPILQRSCYRRSFAHCTYWIEDAQSLG